MTQQHTIISGRVTTWDDAERAIVALIDRGFERSDMDTFYTGPAGRHATYPIGGDAQSDAGAKHAGSGAAEGAAIGGAAGLAIGVAASVVAPVTAPVVLAAVGVGAYGGALAGGVNATEDGAKKDEDPDHPVAKPAGVVLAVRTDQGRDDEVIDALCDAGALAIERARGEWRDGHWVDFDPVAAYEQITAHPRRPQA
jgi:hypothetical protein